MFFTIVTAQLSLNEWTLHLSLQMVFRCNNKHHGVLLQTASWLRIRKCYSLAGYILSRGSAMAMLDT